MNRTAEVVCSVMVLTMTLVVATQVICRYLLGASLTWSEEASRYLLVWITFLGGSAAFKRGMHTGFDAVVRALSPWARRAARLVTLLAIVTFLVIAGLKGMQLALFNMAQRSPAMRLPMGIVYLAIPTGCLLMLVYAADRLVHLMRKRSDGRGP
ncbi:MAG TPA: TRAP transporter small permease [Syntrophobacteria bacterium]|nr:TRAP transporter small permease [Syntrophobacteria bacterium]